MEEKDFIQYESGILNKNEKIKIANVVTDFVRNNQTIGFGSGSTSYLASKLICEKVIREDLHIEVVPTSNLITNLCKFYNEKVGREAIEITDLNSISYMDENGKIHERLDWAFDGADEVDENQNMIKGKGGAMFKEKLNIVNSPKTYILVDNSKLVKKLGEKNYVPVEVFPQAMTYVTKKLQELGARETTFRSISENGNAIIDCKFENIELTLEKDIKLIPGVIESGLFINYNVDIINL